MGALTHIAAPRSHYTDTTRRATTRENKHVRSSWYGALQCWRQGHGQRPSDGKVHRASKWRFVRLNATQNHKRFVVRRPYRVVPGHVNKCGHGCMGIDAEVGVW